MKRSFVVWRTPGEDPRFRIGLSGDPRKPTYMTGFDRTWSDPWGLGR